MTSLREQLAKKRAHSTSLTFPLGEAGERARSDVETAERAVQLAQLVAKEGSTEAEKQAKTRLAKAEREYAKHSMTISFRGLNDEERDTLVSAHPVTDEQREKEKADDVPEEKRSEINRTAFTPAALSVVALDSDLTEDEWAAELASNRWTVGERLALYQAVIDATHAQPAPGLGKGSATIR